MTRVAAVRDYFIAPCSYAPEKQTAKRRVFIIIIFFYSTLISSSEIALRKLFAIYSNTLPKLNLTFKNYCAAAYRVKR